MLTMIPMLALLAVPAQPGVTKDAPVGLKAIRLRFDLDTDAPRDQVENLLRLTERYCVVYQTLKNPPVIEISTGPPVD